MCGCKKKIEIPLQSNIPCVYKKIIVECGSTNDGNIILCDDCKRKKDEGQNQY